MTTLTIEQLEDWRLEIIKLQESRKYLDAKNLYLEIIKTYNSQDIKKENELECIHNFLDINTLKLLEMD